MAIPMTAILSLGSNLGNRLAHLVQAREALARMAEGSHFGKLVLTVD